MVLVHGFSLAKIIYKV